MRRMPYSGYKARKSLSLILILVGMVLLLYPYLTNQFAHYEQGYLLHKYQTESHPPDKKAGPAVEPEKLENIPQKAAAAKVSAVPSVKFLGAIIEIPAIKVRAAVVSGTSQRDLMKGPGWYVQSALPGKGNTAIAGHRTMYGGPFRHLSSLKKGDAIILEYNDQTLNYQVEKVYLVASDNWDVIKPCGYTALTLTSCHPSGRSKRLVVRAALVKDKTGQTM